MKSHINSRSPDRRKPLTIKKPFLTGKTIHGKYHLKSVLGSDFAGTLYEAEEGSQKNKVVIKVLNKGFYWRSDALFELDQPDICRVHQALKDEDDITSLLMEAPKGKNLRNVLTKTQKIPPGQAVTVTEQLLSALHAVHFMNIAVGNLALDSIFLSRDALNDLSVMIMNVGIVDRRAVPNNPFYSAPEQLLGDGPVDKRADIWTVGVILFEMLFGRRPFDGKNQDEIVGSVLSKPCSFPKDMDQLHSKLIPVIERALQKEPDDRYQNITTMVGDLLPLQEELDELSDEKEIKLLKDSIPPIPMPSRPKPPTMTTPSPKSTLGKGNKNGIPKPQNGKPADLPIVPSMPKKTRKESTPNLPWVPPSPSESDDKPVDKKPSEIPLDVSAPALADTGTKENNERVQADSKPKNISHPALLDEDSLELASPRENSVDNAKDIAQFEESKSQKVPGKSSSNRRKAMGVGGVAAVLCILAILLYLLTGDEDESPAASTEQASVIPNTASSKEEPPSPPKEEPPSLPNKPEKIAPKQDAGTDSLPKAKDGPKETPEEEPSIDSEITIALKGIPSLARVVMDKKEVTSPIILSQSEDEVVIEVLAKGYVPFSKTLVPDKNRTIIVAMEKEAITKTELSEKKAPRKKRKRKRERAKKETNSTKNKSYGSLGSNPFEK